LSHTRITCFTVLMMRVLVVVCLALCLSEATSLNKLIMKHKSVDRHQLSASQKAGDGTGDAAYTLPPETDTSQVQTAPNLRLTDDEIQTVINKPAVPISSEEQPFKDSYDAEINKLIVTLTLLAKFYGVFIPDPAISDIEKAQLKGITDEIMDTAIGQARIPDDEQASKSRSQVWEAEVAQGETRNGWYQHYYQKVSDAKAAAPHLSGGGVSSTHGDWTFSLNWVGSTDSTHDSPQDEEKARRKKEEEDIAKQLGDIPDSDPLSTMTKHAYEAKTAPKWEDVFDKINDVRVKEEQYALLHPPAQDQQDE